MPRFATGLLIAGAMAAVLACTTTLSMAQTSTSTYSTKRYLLIISVECVSTTFGGDTDEIYFSVSNGKRFPLSSESPFKIREGEIWEPGFFLTADEPLNIALMEADFGLTSDDRIGVFKYDPGNAVGRFTESMRGDSAEYRVVFEFR